ncbi:IclR family transcriptional regulator [Streptomyces sp. NPDC096934]|uniref:IclR family transcriptional regulator n=1 Tax=Streptomyces sp. NPDC096934 TaxID=3155551 RepID=UPI00331FB346
MSDVSYPAASATAAAMEAVPDLSGMQGGMELAGGASSSILGKAFAILETFNRDRGLMTLSQISRRSGLPKSTAHRVVKMLVELDALARYGEDYRLGPRMFSFGSRSAEIALQEYSMPHLVAVATQCRQLVQLGVLRDREVLYLAKVGGRGALNPVPVGDRLAAHVTALGKAILAFSGQETLRGVTAVPLARHTNSTITDPHVLASALARVRTDKVATDLEECIDGLRCVAVPIFSATEVVAAISVSYPASLGSGRAFVGPLQTAATRISRSLRRGDTAVLTGM